MGGEEKGGPLFVKWCQERAYFSLQQVAHYPGTDNDGFISEAACLCVPADTNILPNAFTTQRGK